MRFIAQLVAILSDDNDLLDKSIDFDKVLDDTLSTSWHGGTVDLATSEANTQVSFGDVTNARWILVLAREGLVTVKLNGTGAVALGIKPVAAVDVTPVSTYQKVAQPGIYFVGPIAADTPITSLYLSNPSASDTAKAFVAVIGEAL